MINTRLSWVVSKCAGKLRRMAGLSGGGEGGLDLYPRWDVLLGKDAARWRAARTAAESGPRVLIATSIGGHAPLLTVESLLAVALTLRGARVHLLLCDESLPACMNASYIQFPDV